MAIYRVIPDGDVLVVDGQVQLTKTLGEYVRVKLRQRFRFFLGEWFRNTLQGVPYFREVLGHNPNVDAARAIFRGVALSIPQVLDAPSFEVRFNKVTRRLAIDGTLTLNDGTALVIEPFDNEFILDLSSTT